MSLALREGYGANDLCHNAIVQGLLHIYVFLPEQVFFKALLGFAAAWL